MAAETTTERRRIPQVVWWLLLAWVALTIAAVIWALPHQEDNLTERAGAALGDQTIAAEFSGRDATLQGEAADPSELDRATATVREVRGVRRVNTGAVVVGQPQSAPPANSTPPDVTIQISDGAVTVSGNVPDQPTADAIMQAARTHWGAENVVDALTVNPSVAGATWLPGIVPALGAMSDLSDGSLAVGPSGAVVVGTVATDDHRVEIESTLVTSFGSATALSNELTVVALTDPSFEAELLPDGLVRLRGVMPDQDTIDDIFAGAAGVYGSANVVNEMSVGVDIASPDYLAALPAAFGAIDGLNPWRISVEAGQATIDGLAVSEDAIAGTFGRLTTAIGSGLDVANNVKVDPTAVATVLTELLEGSATFQIGNADLSDEANELLDEAIEILQANPTTVLIVGGHTDDVGSEEANLALSEARAQAVVDYLVAGGVDAIRLTAVGFGESQPIADNATADGRAQNRRIEFVVEQGDN